MNTPPQISVIMPALDEEKNLARAVEEAFSAFKALGIDGEVLVINDGSHDGTAAVAEKLSAQYANIRIIHHTSNRGIGFSFWDGVRAANGDVVTMLPGDGENDPVEILRYLPLMKEVDIVIPFVYNNEIRGRGRRWLSKLYKGIINFSFGLLLNYMNGTVMYRREVLQSLSLDSAGFFYQTELLIKAIRMGYLYAEVPYGLKKRIGGRSKAVSLKSLLKLTKDYLSIVYWVFMEARDVEPIKNSATAKRRDAIGH